MTNVLKTNKIGLNLTQLSRYMCNISQSDSPIHRVGALKPHRVALTDRSLALIVKTITAQSHVYLHSSH